MKKTFLLLCASFLINQTMLPQQNQFDIALDNAEKNYLINNDSLLHYAQKAINIGIPNNYPNTAEAFFYKSVALFYQAKYNEGLIVTRRGLDWTNKHGLSESIIQGKLYYRLAGNYIMQGLYEIGLEQLLVAQDIFEKNNDNNLLFMNMNGIGVVWLKLKEYDKALNIYEGMLEFEDQDTLLTVPVFYNLSQINFELTNYDDAFDYIQKCLTIIPDGDQRLSQVYYMLGNIQAGLSKVDASIDAYQLSIKLYEDQNNELNSVQPKLGLAKLYLNLGQLDLTLTQTNESLDIAQKYNSLPDLAEVMEVLSKIAEKQNEPKIALKYYKTFVHLSDSLKNATVNQKIANQIVKQEYEKEKQALVFSQQEQELRIKGQIQRQRIIITGSIIIIFLILSILFIQRNKAKERIQANQLLIKKNQIIEEKAKKLDEANSIKNRLFSIIAHDLRNPLSSLQGVIQLIEINAASKEELDEILPQLTNKFENTSILLGNLLEWSISQMEGYKVVIENFDVSKLINDRFEILQTRTTNKELAVSLPSDPVFVSADKNMVGIVILNLLSNAVKFTNQGGKIDVSINNSEEHQVIIQFRDTGKGIHKDRLPYVLNNHFDTTKGTSGEKGTGLGLIICKEFVLKNNGLIWIESTLGVGTSVFLSLPNSLNKEMTDIKK